MNSVLLHELYFDNLAPSRPSRQGPALGAGQTLRLAGPLDRGFQGLLHWPPTAGASWPATPSTASSTTSPATCTRSASSGSASRWWSATCTSTPSTSTTRTEGRNTSASSCSLSTGTRLRNATRLLQNNMRRIVMSKFMLAATWFILLAGTCIPADEIRTNEKSLRKEPRYQDKPGYCFLTFEGKSRIWVVLDKDVLYVDKNGDGDVTEPGERINKDEGVWASGILVFNVGTVVIPDSGQKYSLKIEVNPPEGKGRSLNTVWCSPKDGKGFDHRTDGFIQLSETPERALAVRFAGPLTLTIMDWHGDVKCRKLHRNQSNTVSVLVGTPVRGGTREAFVTLYSVFGEITPGVFPEVSVSFPGKPGEPTISTKVTLEY